MSDAESPCLSFDVFDKLRPFHLMSSRHSTSDMPSLIRRLTMSEARKAKYPIQEFHLDKVSVDPKMVHLESSVCTCMPVF